jgi:hypothetical protein
MVSARFGFDAILVDLAARRRVALHDELIALLESLARISHRPAEFA